MSSVQKDNQKSIICPDCESPINIDEELEPGLVVECQTCGAQSEIVSLSPIKLSILEAEK